MNACSGQRARGVALLLGILCAASAAAYEGALETAEPPWYADSAAAPAMTAVPLAATGAGSLYLDARAGGRSERFLLDTGAAMVTISRNLQRHLEGAGLSHPVRRVAARMADGRTRLMDVARLEVLELAGGCELRDIEVLVLPGEGANLLGLNALQRFAPLTLRMSPLALELSHCVLPVAEAVQGRGILP